MNIFAIDQNPRVSAQQLPDKYTTKMPVEMCQMVSIIYSKWYHNWGEVYKADGTPYDTKKGAFRNHPCTIWLSKSYKNLAWGITHGLSLTEEYYIRYGKVHSCSKTLFEAKKLFHRKVRKSILIYSMAEDFVRAMPDEFKLDTTIDTFTAYKNYLNTKTWVRDNYLRMPQRKPSWIN
jgi:hypothetical protein